MKRSKNRRWCVLCVFTSVRARVFTCDASLSSSEIMRELLELLETIDDADDSRHSKICSSSSSSSSSSFAEGLFLRRLLKHARYLREECNLDNATVSRAALRDAEAIQECCKRVRECKKKREERKTKESAPHGTESNATTMTAASRLCVDDNIFRGRGSQERGGQKSGRVKNTRVVEDEEEEEENEKEGEERVQTNASTSSSSSYASQRTKVSSMRERRARDIERAKSQRKERERKAEEKKRKEEKEAKDKRLKLESRAKEAMRVVLSRENITKERGCRNNAAAEKLNIKRHSPRCSQRERKRPSYMKAVREKDVDAQAVLAIEEVLETLIAATVRSASNAAWKRAKMLAMQANEKEKEILGSVPATDEEAGEFRLAKTAAPATSTKKEKKPAKIVNFVDLVKAAAKESALQKRNRERKEEKERELAEKKRLEKIAFKKQREKAELLRVKLEELRKEKVKLEEEKKREMREKKRIADEKKAWREDRQRRRDQAALEVARNAREKAEVNAFLDALVNEIVRDSCRKAPVLRVPVDIRRKNRRQQRA